GPGTEGRAAPAPAADLLRDLVPCRLGPLAAEGDAQGAADAPGRDAAGAERRRPPDESEIPRLAGTPVPEMRDSTHGAATFSMGWSPGRCDCNCDRRGGDLLCPAPGGRGDPDSRYDVQAGDRGTGPGAGPVRITYGGGGGPRGQYHARPDRPDRVDPL